MRFRWMLAALGVWLTSGCAARPDGGGGGGGRGGAAKISRRQVAAIDSVFTQYARADAPGCAVGVYRRGEIAFSKGYGMADLERNVPITPATVFDLGSTSKQFAAASIILLANEGKLALTDDVRKYVPEVPDYGTPITIDHLLRHTSGLRDYAGLLSFAGTISRTLPATPMRSTSSAGSARSTLLREPGGTTATPVSFCSPPSWSASPARTSASTRRSGSSHR